MGKTKSVYSKLFFLFTLLNISFILVSLLLFFNIFAVHGWHVIKSNIILLLVLILLLLIMLVIFAIIRKLSHPIFLLKESLKRIAYGDFSHRIRIDSNDEFAYLASQFNEMAEKIESMMMEIESSQKTLADQVKQRTSELQEANQKLQLAMHELQDTQKQVVQSEKQKSLTTIVSGFAHEINNPLTGILGYVDLLIIRSDINSFLKEKLLNIQKQAIRIKVILDQLNLLNPDNEQTKLDLNLSNLLDKLVKIVSAKQEFQGIALSIDGFGDDFIILGNHFSLWQVFDNIVENAMESIREAGIGAGRIGIRLQETSEGQFVIVSIEDNGIGFQSIEHAFDPFYTTKMRSHKKGIGLSIAYNIVKDHGGYISIQNNEKQGATVSIHLKLIKRISSHKDKLEE